MDFKFTNEYPVSRLDEAVSFLLGPRLWIPQNDYPDFFDWAQKTHSELKSDVKRAIIAFSRNNIIGAVVYQRHKKDKNALEIKNLTVRPDARGRYIASFLLKNAEVEGTREFRPQFITCDTKAKNLEIMHFLLKHHYRIVGKNDLYRLNSGEDLVYFIADCEISTIFLKISGSCCARSERILRSSPTLALLRPWMNLL